MGRLQSERGGVRTPAVPIAVALVTGILLDRQLDLTTAHWLLFTSIVAVGWWIGRSLCRHLKLRHAPVPTSRSSVMHPGRDAGMLLSVAGVLLLWGSIGGLRHHLDQSVRRPDSIRTYAAANPVSVRVEARLVTPLSIDPADHSGSRPRWLQGDRTIAVAECVAIGPLGDVQPTNGQVRLLVDGHLQGPRVGATLELFGQLQLPSPPMNPGAFDYGDFLRRQGVDAILRVSHPDHARLLDSSPTVWDRLARWRATLRRDAEWVFIQRLPSRQVPLATSLLLGDRSGIDRDLALAFASSGTLHLLAISGLNVGIMAGIVHLACRLMQAGRLATLITMLVTVVGYAWITDQQPPVMRATLLMVIVLGGRAFNRSADGFQSLALCAVALLLYRPADLFDAGTQLSFLAVVAIIGSMRWLKQQELQRQLEQEIEPHRSTVALAWATFRTGLRQAYVMTASIWLVTLPLTGWHFNICSPVGLIVNVLLMPFTTLMMGAGYGMLLVGLAHPLLAIVPATLFSWLLDGLLWIVHVSAATPLGSFSVPTLPNLWMSVFYLLLAFALRLLPGPGREGHYWRAVAVWTALGLAVGLRPTPTEGVRLTFLSVGHGSAVLIQTPSGQTCLYDAGSFSDGYRAQQTIQQALWNTGGHAIDAVIISHADIDHYNGLSGLLQSQPVGSVLIAQSFLDFDQDEVVTTCEAASRARVPLRIVQQGDQLQLGDVSLTFLHPAGGTDWGSDNANSLVVQLDYADRSVLLTGDIEGAGLKDLLQRPANPVDVLLAPHHGSRAANPEQLTTWAQPRYRIVSGSATDERRNTPFAGATEIPTFWTSSSGSIEVQITPTGELSIGTFRTGERGLHHEPAIAEAN